MLGVRLCRHKEFTGTLIIFADKALSIEPIFDEKICLDRSIFIHIRHTKGRSGDWRRKVNG